MEHGAAVRIKNKNNKKTFNLDWYARNLSTLLYEVNHNTCIIFGSIVRAVMPKGKEKKLISLWFLCLFYLEDTQTLLPRRSCQPQVAGRNREVMIVVKIAWIKKFIWTQAGRVKPRPAATLPKDSHETKWRIKYIAAGR